MSSTKPSECRYFISGENKVLKVVALCPIIDSHGVPKPWNLKDRGKVFFPRVSVVYLIISSFGVGDPSDRPVKHLIWGRRGGKCAIRMHLAHIHQTRKSTAPLQRVLGRKLADPYLCAFGQSCILPSLGWFLSRSSPLNSDLT